MGEPERQRPAAQAHRAHGRELERLGPGARRRHDPSRSHGRRPLVARADPDHDPAEDCRGSRPPFRTIDGIPGRERDSPFATDADRGWYYADVLIPVEQFLTGEWGGGDLPPEYLDFELMSGMGWRWDELDTIPPYVKRFCRDFLRMRATA